ncbi:MAG: T9SS type A sorting domain-containing protein [Melioribacteraceae bacterium]|nr:T9SS type A sorting domain-containing protein [Melioribacteraceae bacterium]
MKLLKIILFLSFIVVGKLFAQSEFQEFIQHLYQLPTVEEKEAAIDSFMTYARTVGIPFIEGDKANFVYNRSANSVAIAGDFNGWNPSNSTMTNMSGTNFFFRTETFEFNARLDYKFVINSSNWILDPENPNRVSGGFGPNSELAMPEYIQPWEINYNPLIEHGERRNITVTSSVINRSYGVSVYLPPSYNAEPNRKYPTVYFQDGGEYITLGSSINVIDNLIDSSKIMEVIAVFVTPNNRGEEYGFEKRDQYAEFFATELVAHIDVNYRTSNAASDRLVLGASFGGNISGLISYRYPEVFGNCGLHSSAFWSNDYEVYNMIVDGEKKDIKFAGSWGTYEGLDENMNNFRTAITAKGYSFDWAEYPEGHSWGQWRANIDLILEAIFPYGFTSTKKEVTLPKEFELYQNYPNPFNPATVIKYSVNKESKVKIEITDTLGQRIELLVDKTKYAGTYEVQFSATDGLTSGVYIYSISVNGKTLSKKMQLIK